MHIRPFTDGDDLRLNDVFHDAANPAEHAARNLFRADSESPLSRCVVASLDDEAPGAEVLIGAAAIAASPAHPRRAWAHVEVAEPERRRGVGAALLQAAREAVAGTDLIDLPLRGRVAAGSVGAAAAASQGADLLFTTRVITVKPSALGGLGADRLEDFEVTATGSVALTQAFAAWYAGVNAADPAAEMSLGEVNRRFLSEPTGAHGAALMRRDGEVSAFAVSYPHEDGATELTLAAAYDGKIGLANQGENAAEFTVDRNDPGFQAGLEDTGALLARLSTDTEVVDEVTDEMPVVSELMDGLISAGVAEVLYTYETISLS